MGSNLRSLLRANALPPLGSQIAGQPPHPRTKYQQESNRGQRHGDRRWAEAAEGVHRIEQHERPGEHEQPSDDYPTPRRPCCGIGSRNLCQGRLVVVVAAVPDRGNTKRNQRHRPHDHVAKPEPDHLEKQQDADEGKGETSELTAADRLRRRGRFCGAVVGQKCPADAVEHDTDSAGEGKHDERSAGVYGGDAEPERDPGGDPGDDAVVRPTDELGAASGRLITNILDSRRRFHCHTAMLSRMG